MRLFLFVVILLTTHYMGWGQCEIYPNPITDVVTLKCNSESAISYELFNSLGVRIVGIHGNTLERGSIVQMDISLLADGLYVFVFYEDNKVISTIPITKVAMAEVEKKQKH